MVHSWKGHLVKVAQWARMVTCSARLLNGLKHWASACLPVKAAQLSAQLFRAAHAVTATVQSGCDDLAAEAPLCLAHAALRCFTLLP